VSASTLTGEEFRKNPRMEIKISRESYFLPNNVPVNIVQS